MKFAVVFALLLIAAQANGVTSKDVAKNALRHENLGKRQGSSAPAAPPLPSSPPPSPSPSTAPTTQPPPPPPPTTTPDSSPTTTNDPSPTTSPSSVPSSPSDTPSVSSDTPTTNSDTSNPSSTVLSSSASRSNSQQSFTTISTYMENGSTKRVTIVTAGTDSDSTTGPASATSTNSSNSSSSGPDTNVLIGGIVAGVIVLFGFIAITIRLLKRNKRLERRSKAFASEVERGLAVDPLRPSSGHGPDGPSMAQHQFVPPTENADEYQYRPAEYDPERYYQNVQAQQNGDFYPQSGSPPPQHLEQPYQSRPFSATPVAYNQDVLPPPQYQGQTDYVAMPVPFGNEGYEPRTERDITHANAPSSPSMRPASVPPPVVADSKHYKPDEMTNEPVATAITGNRKPDLADV